MNHYKVCVYAIAKNEELFVNRWMDHVNEADLVIVLDTGSTDQTIEKLKERGALVYQSQNANFRFDEARNECLAYIPDDIDICVSADLDDVMDYGWRENLENSWTSETTRGYYLYNWSFDEEDRPLVQYTHNRIHARKNYHWIYPTHEILEYTGEEPEKASFLTGVVYNHYPDHLKDRSLNLPLLELAVKEDPHSLRNLHYLGREYLFCHRNDECIEMLNKYLEHPDSTWNEERAASMRFIARAYREKNDFDNSKKWLYKAIIEAPHTREPYIEMALLAYSQQDWPAVYYFSLEGLKIKNKTLSYVNEGFAWNETPYDLAAQSCYYLSMYEDALTYSNKAIALAPNDQRLLNNHKFYVDKVEI
ncbi:MAG: hypothetical protein K2G70_03265 [Turicibacter sp.]|nr:hypothetical protein [Turicibacter sp.]